MTASAARRIEVNDRPSVMAEDDQRVEKPEL
jgi:hypothetical protein